MKPVAILQFSPSEGPGHLADFLDSADIPWKLIRVDAGAPLPPDSSACSGMAMMGGPMSVNDPLPWVPPLLDLIRQFNHNGIPLLGHCLGGQLMSMALGGAVTDNKCKEVGWHEVDVADEPQAREWFGHVRKFTTFQWHYQTFSIPPGATRVLRNRYCENQAFTLGPHIGFQCHIEMTAKMVKKWCESDEQEIAAAAGTPSVQSVAQILEGLEMRVGRLNRLADSVYTHWMDGLRK
ncbi:MAG TPA: type 1 glutamine amidotransferase [Novimethylophilus sp.]|jgi:GMP synthase-like glutamine amidotransferase|uniref:type 1 glutamine amidotransferase n=1 Tax=Novimethylophilus sp. TaxID=2137426 RepID=UPI002F402F59